jgi:hypothetical protein
VSVLGHLGGWPHRTAHHTAHTGTRGFSQGAEDSAVCAPFLISSAALQARCERVCSWPKLVGLPAVAHGGAHWPTLACQLISLVAHAVCCPKLACQQTIESRLILCNAAPTLVLLSKVIGLLQTTYGVIQLGSSPYVGAVSDVVSRRGVLLACTLGGLVGYEILALTGSVIGVAVSRVIVGVFRQYSTVSKAMVSELSAPDDRSAAIGYVCVARDLTDSTPVCDQR